MFKLSPNQLRLQATDITVYATFPSFLLISVLFLGRTKLEYYLGTNKTSNFVASTFSVKSPFDVVVVVPWSYNDNVNRRQSHCEPEADRSAKMAKQ